VRELRFLKKLLTDFGVPEAESAIKIGQDNMGTIELIRSNHFNPRTKHVALRYHHVGDQQKLGEVDVKYLSTDLMPADALTKALRREPFERHRAVLLGEKILEWDELCLLTEDLRTHTYADIRQNSKNLLDWQFY